VSGYDATMLILSTWSFGQRANRAAWSTLANNGTSLDAVEIACRDAESDLSNHTVGKGGRPDASGEVSLDASIMLSPAKRGAVAHVRKYEHVVSIARAVMEHTPHVLLVGEGAERFAQERGFESTELLTDDMRLEWESWRRTETKPGRSRPGSPLRNIEEQQRDSHDTIGVLALDSSRTLAGACSTSGLAFKLPGRVGDSPIIGHALYVEPVIGAAVTTGHGELVMSVCGSFLAIELLRRGASPIDAAMEVLERVQQTQPLTEQDQVGIIVLKPDGTWDAASLRKGFKVAVKDSSRDELIAPKHLL
jgi:isoaspartyl peptidase/L-asparaginase-like protein (Ntn-hydrolase superfamily)